MKDSPPFSSIGTFWLDHHMKRCRFSESTYTYIEKGPLGMPVLVGRTVLAGSFNQPNLKDSEE